MSAQQTSFVQTQPRLTRPSLKALFSLPFRICNPPPAVGKVRSCGVTPLYKIRLEDVLERKHLPPLGLKDFEEWLLYVERSAENLYFTLWLKEYTAKYNQWIAHNKMLRDEHSLHVNMAMCSSSHLAMFYARAKQTFFTPNSVYELNLPSSMLAPFHAVNGSPHPEPAAFTEVALEVQKMLQDSLRRFVAGQMNNVGTQRVLCGIIAGTLFCLLGSIAPIVVNLVKGHSRWARLAAFPGMWLGLTILLAALNGVCLGVYVFGDLRQLRKFELSRPPISKPQPLRTSRRFDINSPPLSPTFPLSPRMESQPSLSFPLPAHLATPSVTVSRATSRSSLTSTTSALSSGEETATSSGSESTDPQPPPAIQISQAYYDPNPIEGPAINPIMSVPTYKPSPSPRHAPQDSLSGTGSFTTTASFIHPFELTEDDDWDVEKLQSYTEQRQPVSDFDFDALPYLQRHYPHQFNRPPRYHASSHLRRQSQDLPDIQKGFLARLQTRCARKIWARSMHQQRAAESANTSVDTFRKGGSRKAPSSVADDSSSSAMSMETSISERFKRISAVPAFSALTRVLNPIIVRGQWEIVVRSALLAFLICWIVLGSLLAVPVRV